jgi:hypothetical protein
LIDLAATLDAYEVPYVWNEGDTLGTSFDFESVSLSDEEIESLILELEAVLATNSINANLSFLKGDYVKSMKFLDSSLQRILHILLAFRMCF